MAGIGQSHHPRGQVEVLARTREHDCDAGTKPSETVKTCWSGWCPAGSTPGTAAPCGPGWSRPADPGCCRCSRPGEPATAGRRRRSARAARRCWRRRRPAGWSGGNGRRWRTEWRRCPAGSAGAPAAERHLRQRDEHVREGRRVRLQDRVLRVDVVERHLPRVGVDDDLHRIAHVVVAARAGCCRSPPAGCRRSASRGSWPSSCSRRRSSRCARIGC